MSVELRSSDTDEIKRDIQSFIEARPPLILNPFMRPRPQKGVKLFEEDSISDEPEWVKVYLRLKPCEHPNTLYDIKSDRHFISSVDTATAGHGRRTLHNISKMYTFSHIFGPETSQKEIFDLVVKDNLRKLPEGHNFTLLTYGASGSGKTYTLMGTTSAPGLVPRSLEYVFQVVDAAQQPLYKPADNGAEKLSYLQQEHELQLIKRFCNVSTSFRDKYRRASTQLMNDFAASTFDLSNRTKYYVWVSFVEIYNEKIYDLLTNCDRNKSTSNLQIREDSHGNVYVKGATQAFVRTGEEAYNIMVTAKYNLQVAATGIHAHSSRSHCVFTITMLTETDCSVRSSYVRLCDLAGCERLRQTRNTGARMVESRAINSSLHVLERCLRMLKRKQRHREDATVVPYRESKLTRLLGAGLSGARNEAVTMVVALNPAPHCAHTNRHVLQLATVAQDIQVNSTIAESTLESTSQDSAVADDLRFELMKTREENDRLHFELAQAQSCISELHATMDKQQKEQAETMYEIMEEAKDITREYYEAKIQSLRAEMNEMREDYENQLKAAKKNPEASRFSTEFGTPSRQLLHKTKQLETVLALKEEKLEDSRLACARLEAEVQRLLACIEERDQETSPPEHDQIVSCEESVEVDESDDEQLELTYKDIMDVTLNKTLETGNDAPNNELKYDTFDLDESLQVTMNVDDKTQSASVRGTYFVRADDTTSDKGNESSKSCSNSDSHRDTYFVKTAELEDTANKTLFSKINSNKQMGVYFFEKPNANDSACHEDLLASNGSDSNYSSKKQAYRTDKVKSNIVMKTTSVDEFDMSLAQFEQLEKDTKNEEKSSDCDVFKDIKLLKGKRHIFDEDSRKNSCINNVNLLGDDRSPSIIKDEVTKDFEPDKIKRILGDSLTRPDILSTIILNNKIAMPKKNASVDIFEVFDSPNTMLLKPNEDFAEKLVEDSRHSNNDEKDERVTTENSNLTKKHGFILDKIDKNRQPSEEFFDILTEDKKPNDKLSDKFTANLQYPEKDENGSGVIRKTTDITKKHDSIFDKIDTKLTENLSKNLARSSHYSKIDGINNCIATESTDLTKKHGLYDKIDKNTLPKDDLLRNLIENSQYSKNNEKNEHVITENVNLLKEQEIVLETIDTNKTTENIDLALEARLNKNTHTEVKNDLNIKKSVDPRNVTSVLAIAIEKKDERVNSEKLYHEFLAPNTSNLTINKVENENYKMNSTHIDVENNTIVEFENIYKNLTVSNASAFEQLVLDNTNMTVNESGVDNKMEEKETEKLKYNLRDKRSNISVKTKQPKEEIFQDSEAKCESKAPKRQLRLRRRKIATETDKSDEMKENTKLKDIVNLQSEYSDVTMDKPAPAREAVDIPSPEKTGEEENLPPQDIQSCAKSVTRSRRKLFTPRAEPLEESVGSDNTERVCVPRPSYHRPRARRKL